MALHDLSLKSDKYGQLWLITTDLNNKQSTKKLLGNAPYVKKIYRVIDDGNRVELLLEWDFLGETEQHQIPRGDLTNKKLLQLANYGLDVDSSTVKYYYEFIRMQEAKSQIGNVHLYLGCDTIFDYTTDLGKDIFKGSEVIGEESDYIGSFDLEPKGDFGSFHQFVNEHVKGTPLVLAMLMGLSAAIVGYVGKKFSYYNAVYHLFSKSSVGKSTSAALAVSMGSNPDFTDEDKNTLMRTYDATEHFLLKFLVGNSGFPVCFDEANLFQGKDLPRFVYRVATGVEKGRLNRDADMKIPGYYSTAVISTGEICLSNDSNQNAGFEVRVQQYGGITWTKNAQHAEVVNNYIRDNYGFPIYIFAEHMLSLGKEAVIKRINNNREIFISQSRVKNHFTERRSVGYAILLTTLELANESLGLDLSLDYVLDMLLQNEFDSADRMNLSMKAYEYLIQQAHINTDKFSVAKHRNEIDDAVGNQVWGIRVPYKTPKVIGDKKCIGLIYFIPLIFSKLLKDKGFQSETVVLKELKDDGLLDHETGRYTRTRKVLSTDKKPDELYALRIFETQEDIDPAETDYPTQATQRPAKRSVAEVRTDHSVSINVVDILRG